MNTGPITDLNSLDADYVVIAHFAGQFPDVLHQVALRRDKITQGLIRIGETPGDELNGWRRPEGINVIAVLGTLDITQEMGVDGVGGIKEHVRVIPIETNAGKREATDALVSEAA